MSASVPLGVVGQEGIAPSAGSADFAIFGKVVMLCEGAASGARPFDRLRRTKRLPS